MIGARGIGRHHAHWWHRAGVHVAAIAGTSEETNARTAAELASMFGFSGRCYVDVRRMLAEERPDFVDVCSPPVFHFEHVMAAIEEGCHVLCEKPFVAGTGKSDSELMKQAEMLVEKAASSGRVLGLCSQYAMAAEKCLSLFRARLGRPAPASITAELASPCKGRPPDPDGVWMDLGPHLIACVQAMADDAEIADSTLRATGRPYHAVFSFTTKSRTHGDIRCSVHAFRTFGEPANVRRIVLDDMAFSIEGTRRPDGVYGAVYRTGSEVAEDDDPMFVLIRRMACLEPPLDAGRAIQNMRWLLACRDMLRRAAC